MNGLITLSATGIRDTQGRFTSIADAFGGGQWARQGRQWAERALEITKEEAPEGERNPLNEDEPHLRDELRLREFSAYNGQIDASIEAVGAARRKLPFVLYPTKPHVIRPRRAGGVLRFWQGGGIRFANVVEHPGTKGNRFDKRAKERIDNELRSDVLRYVGRVTSRTNGR